MATSTDCTKFVTALHEQLYKVQDEFEFEFDSDASNPIASMIPESPKDGDPSTLGEANREIRYGINVENHRSYTPIDIAGNETSSFTVRGCDDGNEEISAPGDKAGSVACNPPLGEAVGIGHDVFTFSFEGKWSHLGPWCIHDLMRKEHVAAMWETLMTEWPKHLREGFAERLEELVLLHGQLNSSIHTEYNLSQGTIGKTPTGALNHGYLKRLKMDYNLAGYGSAIFRVLASEAAIRNAINDYRADVLGAALQQEYASTEVTIDGRVQREVYYDGITYVISDSPTRGYLKDTAAGTQEFVRIQKYTHRAGTGEGAIKIPNPGYLDSKFTCDGKVYDVIELAFIVAPDAFQRVPFAPRVAVPKGAEVKTDKNSYNFEVQVWDDDRVSNYVTSDNAWRDKFMFAARHIFGFKLRNPERAGVVAFFAQPETFIIADRRLVTKGVSDTAITIKPHDVPFESGYDDCCDPADPILADNLPVADETVCEAAADPEALIITATEVEVEVGVGSVEPVGISVTMLGTPDTIDNDITVTFADGTATAGDDYVTPSPNPQLLTFPAGTQGTQTVYVTPIVDADVGAVFTATIAQTAGNGTPTGDLVVNITFVDPAA